MSSNEQVLFEKLKALPLEQRAEVEDFVDFLTAKSRRRAARRARRQEPSK